MDSLNVQLKNVILILNTLNEDINKINKKLKILLSESTIIENKFNIELKVDKINNNFITAEILIKKKMLIKIFGF